MTKFLKVLTIGAVVSLISTLHSCKKLNYVELEDADYDWVEMYEKNQLVKFRNPAGKIYTYRVESITRGYREEGDNNYGRAGAALLQDVDTSSYDGSSILVERNDAGLLLELYWSRHPRTFNPLQMSVVNDTVNGFPLSDVYVSVCDTFELTPEQDVIKAYYSKSKGFVKFERVGGDVYTLIN
ncbi:MAG: hypothetical protein IPJ79_12680 [Bacteroidetes bacterium]|nr:hypothetical protein [Bacteroidota bacterium]